VNALVGLLGQPVRKGNMESEADRGIRASTAAFILEYDALCRKYAKTIMPIDDTVPLVVRSSLDDTIDGCVEELRKANAEHQRRL